MRRERLAVAIRLLLLVALGSSFYVAGRPAPETGAATLPSCSTEGYGLEQMPVAETAHRQKAVKLTVGWVAAMEHRRACQLQTTIRVAIVGADGHAAKAYWNVSALLEPWSSVVHTWAWRNWCGAAGEGETTVEFSLPLGRTVRQIVDHPPQCVTPGAASTVSGLGTGTKYVRRPGDQIQPHLLPKGTPLPLPEALIKVKNAWLVSDGYTLVAVYAGTAGNNASIGRLAIIRQNLIFGVQYNPPDLVDVGKVGALRITKAPRGASRETSAQYGQLAFASARGAKGVLELTGDHIRLVRRG